MKRPSAVHIADILVLAAVVALFLLCPLVHHSTPPTGIPDKVVVYYQRQQEPAVVDSLLQSVEAEMSEMAYYLRTHHVDDDGFQLVGHYNTQLQQEYQQLKHQQQHAQHQRGQVHPDHHPRVFYSRRIAAKDRPMVAFCTPGGYWKAGRFHVGRLHQGPAVMRDAQRRIVSALWDHDTIVTAIRIDSIGIYRGQMDAHLMACGQGTIDEWDGCHKEGFWLGDMQHGFGFDSSPQHQLRVGTWRYGRFLGERMKYTAQRIYGIDVSRHQHEKGRRRFSINWRNLRITSFGKRHNINGQTFPVSFAYIKATEGTTVRNNYFASDCHQAQRNGIRVGAYHFFSLKTSAAEQAHYFLKYANIRAHDLPPVLDVEPSDAQIAAIGGAEVLMNRIRTWMQLVERKTGKRPILYVNQMFIRKHMTNAQDIKQRYNVWIARYGEYKPDVKLVYWQLCPDGRASGITGPVDVNVFNGFQGQYQDFLRTGFHQ